ncbi:MAG: uncharacterized protein PWQ09_928 [Candidatus Cloacimonadota bacterium]|nr:uncharacterized protein [Candidatus Cloacimonadota bacterium]
MSFFIIFILFLTGVLAGFINTIAGGGSTLTLPVLILAGIPSVAANATNRIGILFQNIMATSRFHHHRQLNIKPIVHITIAAVLGSILGSLTAVNIRSEVFDKILAGIFLFILVVMFIPKPNLQKRKLPKAIEFLIFFFIGIYGGLIQAGVGFIFLATLNLVGNFNLVKANAVKVFIVLCYTIIAVIIFALSKKIVWVYGLILALGTSLGAFIGVHTAVKGGEKAVKIVLTIAVVAASLKLLGIIQIPTF